MLWMEKDRRFDLEDQAGFHTCKTLLNCYIREFRQENPDAFLINEKENTYAVDFPASGVTVSGRLSYYSAIGEHEYVNFDVNACKKPAYADLVRFIVQEIRHRYSTITDGRAADFSGKVANSSHNLVLYLKHSADCRVSDYLSSEQSLLYGHPFHPFPKNTMGFTEEEVRRFSPELRASFRLCYAAVRKDVFDEEWVSGERRIDLDDQVKEHAARILQDQADSYAWLPMHPWQYDHVLAIEEVKEYIEERKIVPLGSFGPLAYPTSSVRTVYVPDLMCNIKLPLNIQITNMMRNNSREQMRRTMDASRYLRKRKVFQNERHTAVSYEEGICTCRFEDDELTKLFTVAYRPIEFDVTSTYVLSSLIETPVPGASSRLLALIDPSQIAGWFRRYLEISLLPIVRLAEEEGIHFEAHLQNCLLTIRDGMPHTFLIRDLEGVSVNRDQAAASDTTGPLFYSKEEAWSRTAYYFIVNHLGSFIHAIARDSGEKEEYFWGIVRDVLEQEHERRANEFVLHLLTADAFAAKQNLLSCLTGESETPSYVPVTNVMKKVGSETIATDRMLV